MLRRTLAIVEKSFQPDHPRVVSARRNLKALLQAAAVGPSPPEPTL